MSKLKDIEDFLQQVVNAFAAIVDYDINIDDKNDALVGTGKYKAGKYNLSGKGNITACLLSDDSKKDILVEDTVSSIFCEECPKKKFCFTKAAIVCSIMSSGEKVGAIGLLASNEEQRKRLVNNSSKLRLFLQNVANFISLALDERLMKQQMKFLAGKFEAVINSVHEGIIAVDEGGEITHINHSAKELLNIDSDWEGKHINTLFLDQKLDQVFKNMFEDNSNYFEKKIEYEMEDKRFTLLCNITLISDDDQNRGATISFRKLDEMKKLANKLVSAEESSTFNSIKGTSKEIVDIKRQIKKVAATESTILLRGESGTGKSMFARAIHEESDRSDGDFIEINCAAIPESLLETELFGYEEGAFTGAKKGGKPGKFELADKGTIFLDEIGDMPLHFQIKLLKIIESNKVQRVGGVESIDIDTRIIAATHQDLEEMVQKNSFRKDLFYRLNVIPIYIPPLREREADILLLLKFFLKKYTTELDKRIDRFTARAKEKLLNYSWPGNIRELENAIEFAVNMEAFNQITVDSLPKQIVDSKSQPEEEVDTIPTISELEKEAIIKALKKYGTSSKDKEKAAQALGISKSTLYRRINEYDISFLTKII
ncbi:sigma-54 interaction domain-containing protein [Fuchsiella alkaliacetigena]|uniref:sigma-54 interaction domain-containing protein n=1 Tax=Fuchsiella alkaliacetigena TaxID=957042 RepID=UPI00200B3E04|nr:sigma 54-interacting transcriptional regulator [Fuchsiella alkaliacetigena]MCK8826092.1 sigma 54-interacting transcriptional regulator [Fuchsiella alkaliacetigena]